jgi:hypothetical protein
MGEDGMVADLIEARWRKLEPRGEQAGAVAKFHEGGEFVDGEEMPDAVAQLLRDVASVIGKRLGGVTGLPTAPSILQGLRQTPVI